MTLQFIGPRQRGNLFPLGRAMLAALLIGGVAGAQVVATALRAFFLSVAPAIYYIAYLPARAVRKGHGVKPSRGSGGERTSATS